MSEAFPAFNASSNWIRIRYNETYQMRQPTIYDCAGMTISANGASITFSSDSQNPMSFDAWVISGSNWLWQVALRNYTMRQEIDTLVLEQRCAASSVDRGAIASITGDVAYKYPGGNGSISIADPTAGSSSNAVWWITDGDVQDEGGNLAKVRITCKCFFAWEAPFKLTAN